MQSEDRKRFPYQRILEKVVNPIGSWEFGLYPTGPGRTRVVLGWRGDQNGRRWSWEMEETSAVTNKSSRHLGQKQRPERKRRRICQAVAVSGLGDTLLRSEVCIWIQDVSDLGLEIKSRADFRGE